MSLPLDLIVAIVYLGVLIGPSSLYGILGFVVFVPILIWSTSTMQRQLYRMATMRDLRNSKIQEVLNAIKVVKLFNTESF